MGYEFFKSRTVKSRIDRQCDECRATIPAGAPHHYGAGKTEGEFVDQRLCLTCELIISEGWTAGFWPDEGYPTGEVRSELRDYHGIDDAAAWGASRRAFRLAIKNVHVEQLCAETFVAWMAERFRAKVRRPGVLGWMRLPYSKAWAMGHAQAALDSFLDGESIGGAPLPFGHPDHDWSRDGANDIVDTELSYWGEG